ncbi:MAG: efflux RND transporter periplasmic adaptor subunit [Pseudomonadota bacterium]
MAMEKRLSGKWLFWGLMGLLALAAIVFALRPDAVWVDLGTVERGPLAVTITDEGKTRVRDRFVVSSPVAGYLHRVELEVGDAVIPGELLTEVEPMPASVLDARSRAEAQARLAAANSALNSARQKVGAAEADALLARREFERLQSLKGANFVSAERLQQAELAAVRADAVLRSARFDEEVFAHELEVARTRLEVSAARSSGVSTLERVPVRAPVNGAVLGVLRKSEGVVQAGEALVEIGDPGALEVVVELLSYDAVQLQPGGRVQLSGWGGPELEAVVRRIDPVGFVDISALGVEEQRVQVVADIVSPREQWQLLGDGYRVDASFLLWQSDDVLLVPASAVFRHNAEPFVFRVVDGVARLTPIVIGESNGLNTVVESGLATGDQLVRHPDRQLVDGARVRAR